MPPLPTGNAGIAAKYPGDIGIENDPGVVFAEDFENINDISDLCGKWGQSHFRPRITLVNKNDEPENVSNGAQSVKMHSLRVKNSPVGLGMSKYWPDPADHLDAVHMRWYMKWDARYVVPGHHVGINIMAQYNVLGHHATPGIPADGWNKFNSTVDFRGNLNVPDSENPIGWYTHYFYHPSQHVIWGDSCYPDGTVAGNPDKPEWAKSPYFTARPNFIPKVNKWYCFEQMVVANSVKTHPTDSGRTYGINDGRVAFWADGELVADFPNIMMRHRADLKVDQIALGMYISSPDGGDHDIIYWDDVVVAKSYIGPVYR
jgi:hypothetical protein